MKKLLILAFGFGLWMACSQPNNPAESLDPFWRGNTHTHTLWSDGDGAPEWISNWYREQGYNFLVLSDHNILSQGEKWFPVKEGTRLTEARVASLQEQFGENLIETRMEGNGTQSMRLQTLAELRGRFEKPGSFIFLQGEEITDGFEKANIHINAFPLPELIKPQKGESIKDTLQKNFDAVKELSITSGQPIIAHLNHPNFTWSLTWEDFAAIRNEQFFEVYNGHSSVRNYGDENHLSTEEMWDLANTARLREHGLPLLMGMATDDSHHYHKWGGKNTNPGRGWIEVRASSLQPKLLAEAMQRGDFYASSGVELDFSASDSSLEVKVKAVEGATFLTEFIGARGDEIGKVLMSSSDLQSTYQFHQDDLFVRARITSSQPHPNPFAPGDFQMAWLQPVRGPGR
jgi:hypothetical protein